MLARLVHYDGASLLLLLGRDPSLTSGRGRIFSAAVARDDSWLYALVMTSDDSTVRLMVVGSSDAFNAAGRLNACYLFEGAGVGRWMVDFGPTALVGLRRLGFCPEEVDGVLVTHLHGDHIGGLPFLMLDTMYNSPRARPLTIIGPVGLKERIDGLVRQTYGDVASRPLDYDLTIEEIPPGASTTRGNMSIVAFKAEHMDPPEQPLCLRVMVDEGPVLAFSGDTEMCDGLREAAKGVDLLVAECSAMRPPAGRHCTWEDWRIELPKIEASHVLLTHLNAEVRQRQAELIEEVEGRVGLSFADDGISFSVTRGETVLQPKS